MKKLLNTLYVLTPESYLFCRNENICIRIGEHEKLCVPALTIDSIVCFGKMTVSTPLLQYCAEHGISVTFVTETGRFMGRFYGSVSGNVLLRKRQYESLNEDTFCKQLVRSVLLAKLRNCKLVLIRAARSAKNEEVGQALTEGVVQLGRAAEKLLLCEDVDSMRGIEVRQQPSISPDWTICSVAIRVASGLRAEAAVLPGMRSMQHFPLHICF